jgi:hypothetical protein
MTNRNPVPDEAREFVGQMDDRKILNVRVMPDDDPVDVAPNNAVVPDAGLVAEGHGSQHGRTARDVNAAAQRGLLSEKRVQLRLKLELPIAHKSIAEVETLTVSPGVARAVHGD